MRRSIEGPGAPVERQEMKNRRLEYFVETELKEEIKQEIFSVVEEIRNNPEAYIDEGGAGIVYSMKDEALCIKVLHDRETSKAAHLMDIGNSALLESRLQKKLSELSVDGVRCPMIYAVHQSEVAGEPSFIVMEQLDAVNLQHVLLGRADVPEGFDPEQFMDDLSAFLDEMHEKYNISHSDLAPRNIMVDRSGKPRLIDFGRSKILSQMDESEREKILDEDWKEFDEISEKLLTFYEK